MKAKTVILILLLVPELLNAQYEFRPILDPSVICNERSRPKYHILNPLHDDAFEKYDIYYIVEKMPVPKSSLEDIEHTLEREINFKMQEKTSRKTLCFQCIVNCRGEAGDFQIIYCPDEIVDLGDQVLKVFRDRFNSWSPGMQRDKSVDVLVRIWVMVNEGKFKVKAPVG